MGPGGDFWRHVPRYVVWFMVGEMAVFGLALWEILGRGSTSPLSLWFFLATAWLPAAILVYCSVKQPKYALAFGITAAGLFVAYAILSIVILLVLIGRSFTVVS